MNEFMNDYKGPDNPVDIVLLVNMLVYLGSSAQQRKEITRCLQWLKPGGHLVVVGKNRATPLDNVMSMKL